MPRRDAPPRGPRLLAVVLDGEEVIYDPVLREAHLLNPTASMLLGRCDGHTNVAQLVDELQASYGADPAVISGDIGDALADFAARRLVGPEPSASDVEPLPRIRPELAPATDPLVVPESWVVETPVVHALRSRLRVRSDEPVVGRYVEQVLRPLLAGGHAEHDAPDHLRPEHTFDVVTGGPGPIRLLLDGEEVGATTTLDGAMSYLQWSLNQVAIDEADGMVLLHAAGVRLGDRVAVFPAESNSGKSTLAAGMVRAGLGYLTDEAVAIDLSSGAVTAYPKPAEPRSRLVGPLRRPGAAHRGRHRTVLRQRVAPRPERLHPDAFDPGCTPTGRAPAPSETRIVLVAFPTYVAGGPTRFEPLRRAEGLLLLLQNSFNMATAQSAGLQSLAGIAASAQLVRLTVGDLETAVELIRTTLQREPRFRPTPSD